MQKQFETEKMSMLRPSSLNPTIEAPKLKEMVQNKLDDETTSSDKTDVTYDSTEENGSKDSANILKKNCPNVITTTLPLSENSNFVFGENIHERVVGENIQKLPTTSSIVSTETNSNSNASLLFSTALNQLDNHTNTQNSQETDIKSISEVARVYEESRAQKRKYDEVETFTGEEEEINIIELNCKLFAFINANWEERGRGSLRLNDAKDGSYSRVVFRTSGNLRLLLNTKIWSEMVLQRSSTKSVRITAMDSMNQVKIFLIMSRPDDITLIYNALLDRINSCVRGNETKKEQNENSTSRSTPECDEPSLKKPTLLSE